MSCAPGAHASYESGTVEARLVLLASRVRRRYRLWGRTNAAGDRHTPAAVGCHPHLPLLALHRDTIPARSALALLPRPTREENLGACSRALCGHLYDVCDAQL